MKTLQINNPKFIYKEGKPVEVILDIKTYNLLLTILNKTVNNKRETFIELDGATIVRKSKIKTGKDISEFAGIWKNKKDITDSSEYARTLRSKTLKRKHIIEMLKMK